MIGAAAVSAVVLSLLYTAACYRSWPEDQRGSQRCMRAGLSAFVVSFGVILGVTWVMQNGFALPQSGGSPEVEMFNNIMGGAPDF